MRAFVAEMKVRELKRARERLLSAYDEMERTADAASTAAEALEVLSRGLSELRVGERRLHPEVENLQVAMACDDALARRSLERLRREVRQGRARADVLPVYGGILGERLREGRARPKPPDDLLASWKRPSEPTGFVAWLEARIDRDKLTRAREIARDRSASMFDEPISVFTPPRDLLGAEARRDRDLVSSELKADGTIDPVALDWQSALRLAWEEVADWDWPRHGALFGAVWTRTRFRLRPELDLPTATIVEAIGDGLTNVLGALSGRGRLNRLLRYQRLKELQAPAIILENERVALEGTVDLLCAISPDELGQALSPARVRADLRTLSAESDYDYATTEIGKAAAWLAAEAELAGARGVPTYVLKTDLTDFYPSVSHALVDELLRWLEVDPRLCALVQRVLAAPLPDGTRATRGIPLGLTLSRAIGDFLVLALLGGVRAGSKAEAIALVDDILVSTHDPHELSRAWSILGEATTAAGLALNLAKSGSIALRGELPDDAPKGRVQWGLLWFGEGARFHVDEEAMGNLRAITRERIGAHEALLDRVTVFREQLAYAWTWLAMTSDLGEACFAESREALAAFAAELSSSLRAEVTRRYAATLPDAWLHWPLTAGGMGAPFVHADLVPQVLARRTRTRSLPSGDGDEEVGTWLAARLQPIAPVAPVETPAGAALEKRFVERGTRIGRSAESLATYWRWVLATLGPDLLDAYGTFDFVSTDLVPIDLVKA